MVSIACSDTSLILQKVKDELQIFYQNKDSFENASLYKRDKLALCMKMAIDFDKLKYSRYHQAQRLLMDFLHTNETKIHEAINSRQYCAKKILERDIKHYYSIIQGF